MKIVPNHATGADGPKTAGLRKGCARSEFI